MSIELKAAKRTEQGTGASRRLRRAGRVPGIIYGGNAEAQPISVDHNEVFHALRQEAFHASVLSMDLEGAKQSVILRDVQSHPYKLQVLHIDFQRVDAKQKLRVKVPLHFLNAEVSPGVKQQGGIASHVLNEVEIECLPSDLPEFIEVDLSEMVVGHSLHLSQVKLPKGVETVGHKDEDPVIATVALPAKVEEPAGGEGAAGEEKKEG